MKGALKREKLDISHANFILLSKVANQSEN